MDENENNKALELLERIAVAVESLAAGQLEHAIRSGHVVPSEVTESESASEQSAQAES